MLRTRLTVPLALVLACGLLAGFASTASATPYDMRGDWTFTFTVTGMTPTPATLDIEHMNAGGEYSGTLVLNGFIPGTVSGTLTGTSLTLKTITPTPQGTLTFNTSSATLEPATNSVSGSGIYYDEGSEIGPGTMVGTRTKSFQEIKEQEEREQKEREEAAARENVRGEWALTLKYGPETANGIALITDDANSKNEFASSSTVFGGVVPGTFSGTLEGGKATVTVTTEAFGQLPSSKFTSNAMTVTTGVGSLSMSGAGTFAAGPGEIPGELTATRIHTYAEVLEREANEKLAKEAKAAKEAKEAEEARLKQAKEAKEKLEKEALPKTFAPLPIILPPSSTTLLSAEPAAKTLTISKSGALSLKLTNPNAFAAQGHITLTMTSTSHAGKASASKGKKTLVTVGSASFTVASHGEQTLKITLSKSARTELTRHKTLRVTLTINTNATGKSSVSTTYPLTLHAPATHHGKG